MNPCSAQLLLLSALAWSAEAAKREPGPPAARGTAGAQASGGPGHTLSLLTPALGVGEQGREEAVRRGDDVAEWDEVEQLLRLAAARHTAKAAEAADAGPDAAAKVAHGAAGAGAA